jgi:hypothetical protein
MGKYDIIAGLAVAGAVAVGLLGAGEADDLLAVGLLGLAGTIVGRGKAA